MKKLILLIALTLSMGLFASNKKVIVSTTIDFCDVAMQSKCKEGYLTLEAYEAFIKRLAAAGITRINLRTNAIGVVYHNSKYTIKYGENGAWHYYYPEWSKRLIETIKHYDPLAETIRLGHKYGMEVWCWENITDEGGVAKNNPETIPENAKRDNKLTGGYQLVDPFFRTHPSCWATVKPFDHGKIAEKNFRAQQYPIEKIVITSYRSDRPAIKFKKEDIDLYYSYDNKTYMKYDKDFEFIPERVNGRNQLTLKGLSIHAPFIKLAPKTAYDDTRLFTLAIKGHYDSGKAYNTQGEEVPIYWGHNLPLGGKMPKNFQYNTPLSFHSMPSMGIDQGQRQVGFFVGEVVGENHLLGVVEFCDPVAMQHKLNKFSELAAYPFDGYRMSMNCHSNADNPDRFSYHPALRERLLKETGKDIWEDELPLSRIVEERAEGFMEYIQGCKKLIGDRPIYIYGWRPGTKEYFTKSGRTNMGTLMWPYKRMIQEGIVDGICMYEDFSDYFTPEITGGKDLHFSLYRCLESGRRSKVMELDKVTQNKDLDEVEYYGTIELHQHFWQMIKDFTDKQK